MLCYQRIVVRWWYILDSIKYGKGQSQLPCTVTEVKHVTSIYGLLQVPAFFMNDEWNFDLVTSYQHHPFKEVCVLPHSLQFLESRVMPSHWSIFAIIRWHGTRHLSWKLLVTGHECRCGFSPYYVLGRVYIMVQDKRTSKTSNPIGREHIFRTQRVYISVQVHGGRKWCGVYVASNFLGQILSVSNQEKIPLTRETKL